MIAARIFSMAAPLSHPSHHVQVGLPAKSDSQHVWDEWPFGGYADDSSGFCGSFLVPAAENHAL